MAQSPISSAVDTSSEKTANMSSPPSMEAGDSSPIVKEFKMPEDSLLDWDGPDDPGNPRNWSLGTKVYATAIPALYAFAVTFGTSVYTPGIPQVMERFHVSQTVAILGLSLYSEGIAFGPMIGAPISETFGRKAVYIITMPISLLFTAAAGLSQNITSIVILRFFSSAFGAPATAVGAGTISDIWELQHGGGLATVLFILAPFVGSSLGPLVGGYTMEARNDWRWLMWVMLMVGGPIWIMAFFFGETSKKELLRRRAIQRGVAPPPKPPVGAALKALFTVTLFRPLRMLLTEPIVAFISLYVSFAFGVLFAFFDAFPYVFSRVYRFSPGEVGLCFLSIIVGTILAVLTFSILDKTLYAKAKARAPAGKMPPPEERLYVSMLGSLGIPVGLFWFAWTARASVHWISPILSGIPFGWGMVCLFLGTMTYIIDAYHALNAASAVAANGLLRYSFGAAFPLFTLQITPDFISSIITAHGGLPHFLSLTTITVTFNFSGALLDLKGHPGHFTPTITIYTKTPHTTITGLSRTDPEETWIFTPERCYIESSDGKGVRETLREPRKSFEGMGRASKLSDCQLCYFVGYAFWNYFCTPFLFVQPGFHVVELAPHSEPGASQPWRVLEVTWPEHMPAHHTKTQRFYYETERFMLRRFDYWADVFSSSASHYCFDEKEFGGVVMPTLRRVVRRDEETGVVAVHGRSSFLVDVVDVVVK